MFDQQAHLHLYRRRSRLTQSDIAFLLGLPSHFNISRWEKGQRKPGSEFKLLYHILFNYPLDDLYGENRKRVSETVALRIDLLIQQLGTVEQTPKVASRIHFLKATLIKITREDNEK